MAAIPKVIIPRGPKTVLELGSTAILCVLGSEVHKYPLKFDLKGCSTEEIKQKYYEEADSQLMFDREVQVYQRLGNHHRILECFEASATYLRFPYLENGDLRAYLRNSAFDIKPSQRQEWVKQALEAIAFIHSKSILHADISTRNFLLTVDYSLRLCDFAGSSVDDLPALVAEETRYRKVNGVDRPYNTFETEIFAIGSLIFEIISGSLPYENIEEDAKIEALYRCMDFPPTDELQYGCVIRKCWLGEYSRVDEILLDT